MRIRAAHVGYWLLALGVALSCLQLLAVRGEVFYSGDGGLKFLLTKQFAAGDWHADLRLAAAPWVRALWQDGLYPFGPPFAYAQGERWIVGFPLAFMAVSAPFYAALGYAGLYAVPALSLWTLWASFFALTRRLALSPPAQWIGLAGLIFASFTTPYGAMYWEHTLALALSFGGLALLLPLPIERTKGSAPRGRAARLREISGGVLLGAAIWIRPESACFAAGALICLAMLGTGPRRLLAIVAGVAALGLGFGAFNLGVYGSPLGPHAIQEGIADYAVGSLALGLGRRFLFATPALAVAAAFAMLGLLQRPARTSRLEAALWLAGAVFVAGTCLLVPNTGGKQFGARYLAHALPLLWLIVTLQWNRAADSPSAYSRALRICTVLALVAGMQLNAWAGTRELHRESGQRIRPVLANLRATRSEVVAVEHQWMAQELAAAFAQKTFFRVHGPSDLDRLARALAVRGTQHFTLVAFDSSAERTRPGPGFSLHIVPRGRLGIYQLFDCVILPER